MFQFIAKIWKIARAYLCDKSKTRRRILQFAKASIGINAAIGIGKIVMGIYSQSFVFCAGGFYNIALSLAKFVALYGYSSAKNEKAENRYYRQVGVIILVASIAYMIGSSSVFTSGRGNVYFGMGMVALIGAVTAIEIIVSLRGALARRKEKEPLLEALKITSFISSLIGLVLVQTVIIGHIGRESNFWFDVLGVFLGAVSLCVGVYMIASRK